MNDSPYTTTAYTTTHPDAAMLSAYHDGELRGFARGEVAAHVATCPRCQGELSDLDALADALRALPSIEPPAAADRALQSRIAGLRPRHRRRWMRRPALRIAAAVAIIAAALAGYDIAAMPGGGLAPMLHSALPPARHTVISPSRTYATQQSAPLPAAPAHGAASSAQGPANGAAPAPAPLRSDVAPAPVPVPSHAMRVARPNGSGGPSLSTVDARLIARMGQVEMRVPDVQKAYAAVSRLATREGGYVSDSNNAAASGANGSATATLTLRVPAASFDRAMAAIAALRHSTLAERSNSQDITDNYHSLQAQLQALQATRAQLMTLMRQAHSIRDAMTVLDRLTEINTGIDGVQGQIMSSANSVMLSTIAVTLSPEPRKSVVLPPKPKKHHQAASWQPGRDFASAVSNVGRALQAIASIAIYAAVYLFVPALLAGLILATRRLRRVVSH